MAEKKDIRKLSKVELVEMLQRQEKLQANGKFIRSLPDKGQKIQDMIQKLKDMIDKREQADDLTTRFQQISLSQRINTTQQKGLQLDSDDDDDDDSSIADVKMDNEDKEADEISSKTTPKTDVDGRDTSSEACNKHKTDKWAYDSAVTYARKPKFEKGIKIPLEESINIQQEQRNEYEALRAKQATERLTEYNNPASSYSNYTFTSQEAKDQYRDTVREDEVKDNDDDHSDTEDVIQEPQDSDDD